MDEQTFDKLTARVASSRRGLLRIGTGGVLGALLLKLGQGEAVAKCKNPEQKCDKKKDKCCNGAKCKKGRCRCPNAVGCAKKCCLPGQVCQLGSPKICVNGNLEPGDACTPNKALACASGICRCIDSVKLGQVCTCRQDNCLGFGADCTNTSQCCNGGCSGFTDKCEAL